MSTNKLTDEPLSQTLFGATFQNPVLLAAGTCGFGEEIEDALDLNALGGIVTKSVTLEPRAGNPAPRVLEAGNAMLNSVGLANPGLERVCSEKLPWMTEHLSGIQVFVSVAGHIPDEYWRIIEGLESVGGFLGYELNLSCPNDTRLGGLPFALDPEALCGVVEGARKLTDRPLLVKLAPNVPDIGPIAEAAEDAGADGLTLVNTMPGLIIDIASRSAALGAGSGGLSGPALRAVGVHAVHRARACTSTTLLGVGGITTAEDAIQYLLAGASLIQIGTATFADPRAAQTVVTGIAQYVEKIRVENLQDLIGAYQGTDRPVSVSGGPN
ncbi:MAG: dihydroorotate dehydrogenase [Gemmatimonadota bacterium]|nr:dihydroorotate dehydrogenase [Gemmatimonadota bacterium]